MPDNTAKIAALEAILETGATEIVVEGERVKYDFDQIRRQLAKLKADDAATIAAGKTRPPKMSRLRLG